MQRDQLRVHSDQESNNYMARNQRYSVDDTLRCETNVITCLGAGHSYAMRPERIFLVGVAAWVHLMPTLRTHGAL